jgi:hypothetical protein
MFNPFFFFLLPFLRLLLDRISQYEDSDSSDSEKSVELSSDATSDSDGENL